MKWIILSALTSISWVSVSQTRELIDHAVDKYCECVSKAQDKSSVLECDIDIDTTLVAWSEFDGYYLARRMLKQCSELQARLHGSKIDINDLDDLLCLECILFSKHQMEALKLRPDSTGVYYFPIFRQKWVPYPYEGSDGAILKLQESWQMFSENDIGPWINKEQSVHKPGETSHLYFDFLSIKGPQDSDVGYHYFIVIRKGRLACALNIVLNKENTDLITQLVEILANRLRACQL